MKRYGLALLLALPSSVALANVSLKNGNFFIGYSDLVYSGGIEPKVERVYNSKSSHNGIFGFGWGSDYEVFLKVSADGSVIVHENGGGAHNRFTPPEINTKETEKAVDAIMAAKSKSGAGLSGSLADGERKRLLTDARYRNDEWEKLYDKKLVEGRKIAENTELRSIKYSFQTIKKVKEGYVRKFDNGQVQTFDNDGHLARIADKNGNFLKLEYNKAGELAQIKDNLNRTIKFTMNNAGKVEMVEGDGGKKANYKYTGNELTYAKDSDGHVYQYKYSTNGRHNLTDIVYSDNTNLHLDYFDMAKCENVKALKDRDGTKTEYGYSGECNGGLENATTVTVKGADGKEVSKSKFEYIQKYKADGERYTYKLVTEEDGEKKETIYNECCGLPIEITKNGEKTSFEYDTKGHVTKKMTPSEVSELQYHPVHGKVTKVTKYPKKDASKSSVKWADYQYDDKGNLIFAKNSDGKGVKIVYDHTGRIKALVDQNKRRLEFTYNEASRPVEIRDPSVGKIQVQYSNSGEILKVDSAGGRKIAMQVTSAFQNLLEIIRPAGVSLSF